MIKKARVFFLFVCLFFGFPFLYADSLKFDSRYSTLKINSNATFSIDQPIANWDGTLIRAAGATISGANISFVDGLLEDEENQILLSAVFNPAGTITLGGGSSFRAQPGTILQSITVDGINNRLSGQPIFTSPLTLTDSATTLTLGIQSQMNRNLVLNGGTVALENDLVFTDGFFLSGDGTINGNRYKVVTGGDPFLSSSNITWCTSIALSTCLDFSGSFTFSEASSTFNGNGYVLDLSGGGTLTIGSGVTLTLADMVVKGLGDGAASGKIVFTDDTSTLLLTNVTFLLNDNLTTDVGTVEVKGPMTAVVKDFNWLFDMTATLTVDCVTLWKDVAGAESCGDILFTSASNQSLLNDGTIDYITLRCTSIIEALESCCEVNDSRIDLIESCCEVNDSRIDLIESCCEINDSRIDLLESCCEVNDSRIDLIESCCEINDSRIDLLESCCEVNDSRIDLLESCCEALDSRVDILESEIDNIIESFPDDLESRIDLLESCCEVNDSRIDVLESEIDTIVTETCDRPVCTDIFFDLSMLPGPNETVLFEFCKCFNPKGNPPSVIFDPAVFGNNGRVVLPEGSRLGFCGFGTVDIRDGVTFEFTGSACGATSPQADWPELILDECACMVLDMGATATIGGGSTGAGCFTMRKGGCVLLDQANSHLIFGEARENEIIVKASMASHITVDNPSALISFHLGVFDLLFENHSALQISDGTIEMNTINGFESPGVIRTFEFNNDSCLVLPGQCDKRLGLLRLAPNDPSSPCDTTDSQNVAFNNLEGEVCGNGDLQFVSFDAMGTIVVNSTTRIQPNNFCFTGEMKDIFMMLSYFLRPALVMPPDADILAIQGTRPEQDKCGRLVAFCPARDGSFVGLAQGDHDVFYDSSVSCGTLDLVRGYDRLGRVFTISNCDENTRAPKAPPLT